MSPLFKKSQNETTQPRVSVHFHDSQLGDRITGVPTMPLELVEAFQKYASATQPFFEWHVKMGDCVRKGDAIASYNIMGLRASLSGPAKPAPNLNQQISVVAPFDGRIEMICENPNYSSWPIRWSPSEGSVHPDFRDQDWGPELNKTMDTEREKWNVDNGLSNITERTLLFSIRATKTDPSYSFDQMVKAYHPITDAAFARANNPNFEGAFDDFFTEQLCNNTMPEVTSHGRIVPAGPK